VAIDREISEITRWKKEEEERNDSGQRYKITLRQRQLFGFSYL